MNDDTKALVERAREVAGYKYQHHTIHVPVVLDMLADAIERLGLDRDELRERMGGLRELVGAQAEDDGLWFAARTAPEAYLQRALRDLHTAVELAAPKDASPHD